MVPIFQAGEQENNMKRDSGFGELVHEFIGTAVLILLGDGVVANVLFGTRLGSGYLDFSASSWIIIVWGWGMAVAVAVYVAGGLTGAHINPAVTLAAVVRRGMPLGKAIGWMIAQVAGGFFGAFLVWVLYRGEFFANGYTNVFYTAPMPNIGPINAVCSELIGTTMLLFGIYGIVDSKNLAPGNNMIPLVIGLLVFSIGLSLGMPTGYAINPARDFGPRLFANLLPGGAADAWSVPGGWSAMGFNAPYFWVPIVAPLIGGPLGAWLYDIGIAPFLKGGE
jgi:glycerol uptake facilitator protein